MFFKSGSDLNFLLRAWHSTCYRLYVQRFHSAAAIACVVLLGTLLDASPRAKRPVRRPTKSQVARNVTVDGIEDSSKTDEIRPGASGSSVTRAQILLDRARFSPGEIDGRYGSDLEVAIKAFQENHGLNPTGIIDPEMWKLLNADPGKLLTTYTITKMDVKGPFNKIPSDVQEKARMKWLGFESVEEKLGEKFHSSPKLLAELNPGKKLDSAGEEITVPEVRRPLPGRAARVVVSKSKRTVTAFGADDKPIAHYPATIGGVHDPLPIGSWRIVSVQHNPWFFYNPERFWNANPKEAKAKLPPGPNNPAGVVWMGLSKEHYGIHGTPEPAQIRHGESAGCIRLTNWDADDLSRMVRRGTPAILEE